MRKKLISLNFLIFFGLGTISFAQVTGVVSDENNFPESDIEVVVRGTNKSVFTDENGNFNIDAKIGDVLIIDGKEFKVTSSNLGVLKYKENPKDLEEVVVVAYGKQRKEAIVGSVSVVDEKVIEKQQATSPLSALQGSAPGVNIINSGGQPGSDPQIRIRGVGSIEAYAEPLIVVDGVPFNGSISLLNQDMIKSITVLKDAGSTALYGARAANGVILVETKVGKFNIAPQVTFKSSFGVANQAVDNFDKVGSNEFMKYTWEALKNDYGAEVASNRLISRLGYNPYGPNFPNPIDTNGNLVSGANLLWDTDWKKLLQNSSPTRREYTIGVDGGTEKTSYSFGASYLNQGGPVKTSYIERTNIRAKVITKPITWLELGVNSFVNFINEKVPLQSGSGYNSPIQWINTVSSIYPSYRRDANGNLITDSKGNHIYDYGNNNGVNGIRPVLPTNNAVGILEYNDQRDKITYVFASGYSKFSFNKFLSFKTSLSYQSNIYDYSEVENNTYGLANNVNGRVTKTHNIGTTKNIINSLNFDKSFEDHNLKIDAIMELYEYRLEETSTQSTGFLTGNTVLSGTTTPEYVSGAIYKERNLSYMGRLSYDYSKKYFLEGLLKKEASTRFDASNRWGTFYAVGGSWIISRENFLKDSKVIYNLKLRGSYGVTGNNKVLDGSSQFYFPYAQVYWSGYSNLNSLGLRASKLVDPNITWEKQSMVNIGVDFGFFNNRISGTIEYYNKESIDLIMGKAIAPSGSMGQSTITTNIGSMKNYGFDFSLHTKNIISSRFEWTTDINIGTVKNKLTKLNGSTSVVSGTKILEVGGNIYNFYLPEWAGVNPENGKGMWYRDDANGNKIITEDYGLATYYKQNESSLPDFEGGFTNYFRYKNFDLNIVFNFSVGSYIYDYSYSDLMSSGQNAGKLWSIDIKDRWQNPGDITNTPRLTTLNNNDNSLSTRFLFKNNYLRLKALNFGYNFSESSIQKIGLKGLRIYFQGDNLLTFQSHKGIDPEQYINGLSNSRSYQQRIYTIGLSVKL